MVVIGLLGILAAGLIVMINPVAQTQKAKDGQRKSDLRQIQTGLELYRSDHGGYPAAANMPSAGGTLSDNNIDYIKNMPGDPNGGNYLYVPNGGGYDLYSCAENDKTPEVKSGTVTNLDCDKDLYFQVSSL